MTSTAPKVASYRHLPRHLGVAVLVITVIWLTAASNRLPAHGASPPATTIGTFSWPTGKPAAVLRPFQPPATKYGAGHRGVDLSLPSGAPVVAAGSGTIAFAGQVGGTPVVAIAHPQGFRTTYLPVSTTLVTGTPVTAGTQIGTLEAGHCAELDCLHWGAKFGTGAASQYFDPLFLLSAPRYRLIPLDP